MKRCLSLILVFALVIACAPVIPFQADAATIASGTCGSNVTWAFDNTGTLTISGTGRMSGYSSTGAPWYHIRTAIKKVVIEDGVTSIGSSAFENCGSLTSVVIGDSVTSISVDAFYNCSSLTSIEIPDSVTSIGGWAFRDCSSLTSIEIPDGVTSIGDSAFRDCSSLTSVIIGDSVTSIGNYVFNDCSSLTGIWVDADNTAYCSDEQGVLYNKDKTTLIQAPVRGITGTYTIPDSVTSIGDSAFYKCSSLTSVVIPDSVTSIGSTAFLKCSSLTSVIIGDSVTSIGSSAFNGCSSLTSVVIGDSVTSIGDDAFRDCSSLTSVEIPDSVTSIDSYAFWCCSSLTSVVIGDSVTSIGDYAFYNCSSLTSIEIPDSVTSIGNAAFQKCSSLTSIEIPDGVTSIGKNVFYNCSSLISVVIPDSVTSIDSRAFFSCSSLTSVVIGDSVTSIGDYAFYDCSSLSHVAYTATQSQWNRISIGSNNSYLTAATRHYETSFEIVGNCVEKSVYCPVCKEFIVRTEKENHQETTVPGYAPTCTEPGLTDGSVCTLCGEVVTQQVEIPATGHDTIDGVCQNCDYGKNVVILEGDGETFYSTVENAMAAATGGTIKLLTDMEVGTLVLPSGVKLDLNGYTLTAQYLIVMQDADILDGNGCLKIAKKNLVYAQENGDGIIPVWNGVDGYIFTKVAFQQMAVKAGAGAAQYIFLPNFSNAEAAALLADGGADNGIKMKVSLVWNEGQCQQFYTYSDAFVEQVFASNGGLAFSLTVTGISGIDDMVANAIVVTDSGTQATNVSTAIVAG